ncbi:hypothetical protein TNCV_3303491 [Trichonephila clavipes]|nr:hypothetical protein TNCV_3303491 [Trichonephila clavipes]
MNSSLVPLKAGRVEEASLSRLKCPLVDMVWKGLFPQRCRSQLRDKNVTISSSSRPAQCNNCSGEACTELQFVHNE